MKGNTGTADHIQFDVLSTSCAQRKKIIHLAGNLIKKIPNLKELLQAGAAIIGIGSMLLLSIYLFFTQLAEFGW